MKTITIKIHKDYAEVLTITAVGRAGATLNVSTHSIDISKHNTVIIDENGKVTNEQRETD